MWALGRALGGQRSLPRYTLSLAGLWLVCSACLVGIYVAQEFLEGLFATGHPGGLAGIFGYGGWWSIPAAVCVGLVLAAVFHGARWVLDEVAQRRIDLLCGRAPRPARLPRPRDVVAAAAVAAGRWLVGSRSSELGPDRAPPPDRGCADLQLPD